MSQQTKKQIIGKAKSRYSRAGKRHKTIILNEICALTDYDRKHLIKLLRDKRGCRNNSPGRKKRYGEELCEVLNSIWHSTGQMCSKRLAAVMEEWLGYYEKHHGGLIDGLRQNLLTISPAQIDRLLKPYRISTDSWKRKGPKPGTVIRSKIPLRTGPWEEQRPGYLEVDTVAHCGGSMAGNFIWSITYTDIASGWTSLRSTWNRGQEGTVAQTSDVESTLPFKLLGFDCDNGPEFLNNHMYRYLKGRSRKIDFTRSRPYHKNDNAHVEQKNWTHVRQLLGYDRLGDPQLVALLNDLYRNAWEPLHNYFYPCAKLISKERIGSRYRKKYDKPKTPYQRLLDSDKISAAKKKKLRKAKSILDPFELRKLVEQKLKCIFDLLSEDGNLPVADAAPTGYNGPFGAQEDLPLAAVQ